ncbi:hypothetical protein [Cellulomonas sp. GbtcB1]|uniref:hypothetical protein n=1 Tax=Cellulomonas sp. GbtcB1 TaxID=2824746 RepID=UPI001C3079D7|nr:hypothetical protein [Cellulomonas sp. GbtcB1]
MLVGDYPLPDVPLVGALAGAKITALLAADAGPDDADLGGSSTSFFLTLQGYDVEVTEQPGPGGRNSLVYRVTR